jgi:hypothetical protein
MSDIRNIINSIFKDLIVKSDFKIIESDAKSILFQNKFCFLFIGHHMGETYVHLMKNKNSTIILPFMWAMINEKIDYRKTLPIKIFDHNTNSLDVLKYQLVVEKTLISLFCLDILNGDFSNLNNYELKLESQNKLIYDYYSGLKN